MSNNLENRFKSEDDYKDVVEDLENSFYILRLAIPNKPKNESIGHNAEHDYIVELSMLSHPYHKVTQRRVLFCKPLLWLCLQNHIVNTGVSKLHTSKVTVTLHNFFLTFESLNNHTHEELNEEKADEEDKNHRVQD